MSERVTMPALGESVTEGTVTRWLKAVGERVEVDEPLLEVSTDKVDTEIPSPVAGVLEEILVQEDDTVPVGADLAVIGDGSGGGDQEQAPAAEEEPAEAPADNSGQSGDGDAIDDAQDANEVAQAGDQGGQEPAQPSTEAAPPQQATADTGSGDGEVSGGTTVTMPALGESVTEGTITRWLKAEGDDVAVDEPLLEARQPGLDPVDIEAGDFHRGVDARTNATGLTQIPKLDPQPHPAAACGFSTRNAAPPSDSTKSTTLPATRSSETGSTTSFTPEVSLTESSPSTVSARSNLYWKPEQPPPSTDSRSIAGLFCLSAIHATRFAAASVRVSGSAMGAM